MFVRNLISDLKAYPATLAFCIAWIFIFVAMVFFQVNGWSPFPWKWSMLMIGMTDGNQFGDLTIRDFRHGEVWRLITCNFVHYGLLHIGLNLLAMYQLGAIVEDWYGSYQMLFIYAITGGLGNLVSVTARMMLGHEENVHSGGGSVVILGLVGLCAVVGWRSRTRRGVYLGQQMINVMILTAVLGVGFPLFVKGVGVDNWGHAGGAIIGSLVGLMHHQLGRNVGRPRGFELGMLSLIVMLGCGFAQARNERGQTKHRGEEIARLDLRRLDQTYQIIRSIKPLIAIPAQAAAIVSLLERLREDLEKPATVQPYRRMLELGRKARQGPLSAAEIAEFQAAASSVEQVVRAEYQKAIDRFWSIRKSRSEPQAVGR